MHLYAIACHSTLVQSNVVNRTSLKAKWHFVWILGWKTQINYFSGPISC